MARTFVCFFALFILSIAIRFGDCENNTAECNDKNIIPGSDETHLSEFEKILKKMLPAKSMDKETGSDKESVGIGSFGDVLEKLRKHFPLILPGTRWCGDGDKARNDSDLGILKRTDACCKAHDKCQNDILANETEVNLKNNGIFTRSACTCDRQFYSCLKNARSLIASEIGFTYFDLLRPQCFECICPEEDCDLKDNTECKSHCKKYKWVDNERFE